MILHTGVEIICSPNNLILSSQSNIARQVVGGDRGSVSSLDVLLNKNSNLMAARHDQINCMDNICAIMNMSIWRKFVQTIEQDFLNKYGSKIPRMGYTIGIV